MSQSDAAGHFHGKSGEIDVLIFDEFQAAYAHGLLDKETAKILF
ncbi:MAG: hypothetical protein ACLURV_12090 [Gallintestinimicrobium sp.]